MFKYNDDNAKLALKKASCNRFTKIKGAFCSMIFIKWKFS